MSTDNARRYRETWREPALSKVLWQRMENNILRRDFANMLLLRKVKQYFIRNKEAAGFQMIFTTNCNRLHPPNMVCIY